MLKLETQIEKTAKSVIEAKEEALAELGLNENEVDIEVIDEGTKGFLGLGSKDAKIIVKVKEVVSYKAKAFLKEIFDGMKLDVNIETKLEGEELLVELSGDKMGIVIGKRGETLDGLQYLTTLVVNKDSETYYKVVLNTENYREKRLEALTALSEKLAEKVARTGRKYALEPMNPYERRIIHSNLQNNENVTTFSVGTDPYRKVVIAPKNTGRTPYYKKNSYSSARPHNNHKHSDYESYAKSNTETDMKETTEE